MDTHRIHTILAPLRSGLLVGWAKDLLTVLLSAALLLPGTAPALAAIPSGQATAARAALTAIPSGPARQPVAGNASDRLEQRLSQWPAWQLPAPLRRAGPLAPTWPDWFAGEWWVHGTALAEETETQAAAALPPWRARFVGSDHGVVADRAFNAASLARSLLPGTALQVQDDPADPRRQLARLGPDQLLETTLLAWRLEHPASDLFLNDELSLEVLRGSGPPRLSRVETLGRWQRRSDGSIDGEQWQARFPGPDQGLIASPMASEHLRLRLVPAPPGSDRAS